MRATIVVPVVLVVLASLAFWATSTALAEPDHNARAAQAFRDADYKTALREYEEVARERRTPEVQMQIARCLDRLLKFNDAVVAYLRFLHVAGARSEAKEARDRIAFLKQHLAEEGGPERVGQLAIDRGTALFKIDYYTEARAEFEEAVTALPDKPNGYRWLGLSQEKLGQFKQAVSNFDNFLSMVAGDDSRVAEVREARARCVAKLEKAAPREAPAAPRVAEGKPDREALVTQQVSRGEELFAAGRYKEAREAFSTARSLAPDKATPWRWLGLVDAKLDRCSDAITNLEAFLQKVPKDDPRVIEAREVIGDCRARLGSRRATVEARPAPAPTAPPPVDDDEARAGKLIDKGTALYQQGRFAEARDAFDAARRLVPDRAGAYRWLGLTDTQLGRCRDAIGHFDAFLARVPRNDDRVPEVTRERDRCRQELSPRVAAAPQPAPRAPVEQGRPAPRAPRAESGTPSMVLPIAVGAAALVVLGTGAGVTGAGVNEFNTLKTVCAPNCSPQDISHMQTKLYSGYALLGLGGAAAVADVVLWYFWASKRPSSRPHVLLTPTLNGAQVFGTF